MTLYETIVNSFGHKKWIYDNDICCKEFDHNQDIINVITYSLDRKRGPKLAKHANCFQMYRKYKLQTEKWKTGNRVNAKMCTGQI